MAKAYHRAMFHGQYDATSVTVTVTMALALYNSLELLLLIFTTFNKWRGLYFWSLVIATVGVMSYCCGLLIEYFNLTKVLVGLIFDNTGWMTMITGQSFVLYSRLGLIVSNRKLLQGVKWMIICDAFIFHLSTTVLNFGGKYGGGENFIRGYFYIEYIQMTFFCLQEFIISGIYVWQTVKLLQVVSKQRTRLVMWQLFIINVIIVILDIVLLVIQYKNLHIFEQSVKALVYSVKLKLEFAILGKLVDLVQSSQRTLSNAMRNMDDCVERSDTSPSLAHTASPGSSNPWLPNRTKLPVQHVENAGNVTLENEDLDSSQHDTDEKSLDIAPIKSNCRQRDRESDIMYADIMRSMSKD